MTIKKAPTALLFPGQAAHYAGMGRELYQEFFCVQETFSVASYVANCSMPRLCFEDPDKKLSLTEYAQPSILTVSVAVAKLLEYHTGIMPYIKAVAGHSLGEISALAFGRAFMFADALRLVIARAKAMQRAVPVGQGSMAAIIGLGLEAVQLACQQAADNQVVVPANINSPNQIVISGHREAVDRACQLISEAGARKIVALEVSAPFHCSLMEPAAQQFSSSFKQVKMQPTTIPVYRTVDNTPHGEVKEIQEFLAKQLTTLVDWPGMISSLQSSGIEQFIIVCPGRVLGSLIRQIDRSIPFYIVEDLRSFEELLAIFPR